MFLPFYRQSDSMDCGPTCLRMVTKFYKRNVSLQYLRDKTQIGKEGVNLLGISEAAEMLGFRTQAVKLTLKVLLEEARLPAILHWHQNHFVVLYKTGKKKVVIADPKDGIITLSLNDFKQFWISDSINGQQEGIALLLEPSPEFYNYSREEGKQNDGIGISTILKYILPYKKLIFQLFLGLGMASLLQLLLPFLTQSVVDVGISSANLHFVFIILLAQLALFAGRITVEFIRSWILLHISTRINISILTDFLIKLMKLPVSFFDSKNTGDIMQRMNDHSRIESFLTGTSINALFSILNLTVFSVVLALFNLQIFFVFSIASIMYLFWVLGFLRKRRILDYKMFEVASKEQSATIQLIQGMQEIKLNGVEKPVRWAWERLQAQSFKLSIHNLNLNQWQQAGAYFINEGKNIFITFLAAKAVIEGQMSLGTMLAIQYMIGQLNSPIEQMIGFFQSWQNAKISMERLNEIHQLEDEEPYHKQLQPLTPALTMRIQGGGSDIAALSVPNDAAHSFFGARIQSHEASSLLTSQKTFMERSDGKVPGIVLSNIHFKYEGAGNEPVLTDINLYIELGKTTAIVGGSGSGKTTLLKLLLKFYEPQKGEIIFYDSNIHESATPFGTRLSSISHKDWRSHCGVVMQESFIFSDTIARNIAVGAEKIDINKLRQAISVANIQEFIDSLPLGFNTKIGAEGLGVSMGQKQRILIARAVYRNPNFIFLDEATNSLDANNESIIVDNLASFLKGKTVIVVAHRLSTVKHADQIIVLNKGRIIEKGRHKELVDLQGEYYTLVKNQLELGNA